MMGSWRRRRNGESCDQEVYRIGSENRIPSQEILPSTVPLWEKQFCSSVGSIPWRKFLEMKSSIYLYDEITKWDDSAGEEAFKDAKNRFFAKIKGIPCDTSLPDPDKYIDTVDWNSNIDPELVLDLEREPNPLTNDNNNNNQVSRVVTLTEALLNQSFSCNGWGETEEEFRETETDLWKRFDRRKEDEGKRYNPNRWAENFNLKPSGCDERRRDVTGWYDSRYKTSRFPNRDYQIHREYRDRRKKVNFAFDKYDSRNWTIQS